MEKFESPKNKKKEDFIKDEFILPDGKILEAHYNTANMKIERFFIKDKEGKLLEFIEIKNIDFITPEMVGRAFFNKGIVLKKEEIEKITRKFIKMDLDAAIDNIDENKSIEN